MKTKRSALIVTLNLLLTLLLTLPALGQDEIGSISGTVYRDSNENGLCVNEGETIVANIPLEIINDDTGEFVRYTTEANGTYVHTTSDLGLWQVTVIPGPDWRITSQQTITVDLTEDELVVSDVNFCIVEVAVEEEQPAEEEEEPVTLPQSGAIIAPSLLYAGLAGFILLIVGLVLLKWSNR